MRSVLSALALALFLAGSAHAAEDIRVELNAAEPQQNRCQLSFLIENKTEHNLETLKLDLAVFNTEGVIQRRLAVDLGPVRKAKTIVKAFAIEGDCGQISAILLNDVNACTPLEAAACLEQIGLSSKPKGIRLYK